MGEEFDFDHDYTWGDVKMTFALSYPSEISSTVGTTPQTKYIVGVERVTTRTESPHDIVDSIQEYNQGLITKQKRYTFTITTKERGSGFEWLTSLQEGDRYFDLVVVPASEVVAGAVQTVTGAGYWGLVKQMYIGCKVESKSTSYEIADIPRADFDCKALGSKYETWSTTDNTMYGDGYQGPLKTDEFFKLQPP